MSSLQDETQAQTELLTPRNNFNDKNFEHILTNRENSFSIEVIKTKTIKTSCLWVFKLTAVLRKWEHIQ